MTPYKRGYDDTMEKLARGMFPTIRRLFQMGIKPGSGVSLLPFTRGASRVAAGAGSRVGKQLGLQGQKATSLGNRILGRPHGPMSQEHMMSNTLLSAPSVSTPRLPRRMMPDVRDVLRQRAQAAGTYSGL